MKHINGIKYFCTFTILMLILPYLVYGESDSVVGGIGGDVTHVCSTNCENLQRSSSGGGLRFTFINQRGEVLSNSFDFTTKTSNHITYYNSFVGDKSKLTGTFKVGQANIKTLPKLSYLIYLFNNSNPGHQSTLKSSSTPNGNIDTGGQYEDKWEKEKAWFKSLTDANNDYYVDDVNAFIKAIEGVYPDQIDAKDLIIRLSQACNSEEEIFIMIEPIFYYVLPTYSTGSQDHFYGTLRDFVLYFDALPPRVNDTILRIAYDRKINAPTFTGFDHIEDLRSFTVQSKDEILNSKAGFAMGLDWATDPGGYCNGCVFKDGKFYYDDKEVLKPENGYTTLAEYALSPRSQKGLGCCSALGKEYDSLSQEWKNNYNKYCNTPKSCSIVSQTDGPDKYYCKDGKECTQDDYLAQCDGSCCSEPLPEPEVSINNCCTVNTNSYVKEPELDKMFCDDTDGGAKNSVPKCTVDELYKETDATLNNYCSMYCSEDISVDIPEAITATSGKYFKLAPTKDKNGGTYTDNSGNKITSPYIDGHKSCRIITDYDQWYQDYKAALEDAVAKYNAYQEAKAKEVSLSSSNATTYKSAQTVSGTVTCNASCSYSCGTTDDPDKTCDKKADTYTASCTVKYNRYSFNSEKDWYKLSLNDSNLSLSASLGGTTETFKNKTKGSIYDDVDVSDCNSKHKSGPLGWSECSASWSCNNDYEIVTSKMDVDGILATYKTAADTAKAAYETAIAVVRGLESDKKVCDNFFIDTKDNEEEFYNTNPTLEFSYSQIYRDEYGDLQEDNQVVDFKKDEPVCNYDAVFIPEENGNDPEGLVKQPRYTSKYGENDLSIKVLKTNIQYVDNNTNDNVLKTNAEGYKTSQQATHDAKYHVECYWEEQENTINTLVPSGAVEKEVPTSIKNFTRHKREYRVYLTTLDGEYQTYWKLNGLGSKGRFDQDFTNGETCSNEEISDNKEDGNMTCVLHVEYELILTGRCNGTNGTTVTTRISDCDEYREDTRLFNFRFVDPANVFPSGTTVVEDGETKEIAKNWTATTAGKEVLEKIQELGQAGTTYAPENLTYSFVLAPSDMEHIKNYNKQQVSNSEGYSDFDLVCTCDEVSCTKCRSTFIENLSNGIVKYDGTDHKVNGWNNKNATLQSVRENNNW